MTTHLTTLQQAIQQAAADYIDNDAVSLGQGCIWCGDGPSVAELSELLGESIPTIENAIGRLVAAGLGYTEIDNHDGQDTICYYPKINH